MTTAELIISRLPNTPTVSPADIQAAANLKSANGIINAIRNGKLSAVKIGSRYVVSRESAINYIQKCSKEATK